MVREYLLRLDFFTPAQEFQDQGRTLKFPGNAYFTKVSRYGRV